MWSCILSLDFSSYFLCWNILYCLCSGAKLCAHVAQMRILILVISHLWDTQAQTQKGAMLCEL